MNRKIYFLVFTVLFCLLAPVFGSMALADSQSIIYVGKDGNDTTGDGSAQLPYASVDVAINKAPSGSAIYIKAGTYHLRTMTGNDQILGVGIHESGKQLTIYGDNEKTILEYYGAESTVRDGCAFQLFNGNSVVRNLTMNFYPGKGTNYSNAIFRECRGMFYNVYFHIKGSIPASYSYFNNTSGYPNVFNCTFYHDLGKISSNYSSQPVYTNCLYNVAPIEGTKIHCVTASFNPENIAETAADPALLHTGTGTNPDGSVANIGVYGGKYAWGYNSIPLPSDITASVGDSKVTLSWKAAAGATAYKVKWGTEPGKYTNSETVTDSTSFDVTGLTNGTAYYFVVSTLIDSEESPDSNEVSAVPKNPDPDVTLTVEAPDTARINNKITVDIVIHNAKTICAEDIQVNYDTELLEFTGVAEADGMKIFKESDVSSGLKRYITACLGKANAANGDKVLLKLVFKAKKAGEAKVNILRARIADNAALETDVAQENCTGKTIVINSYSDINRSGEFTLLDLGIDAYYYGDAASLTDTTKYDADIIDNGTIDDDDLSVIVAQMLANDNYSGNK